MITGTKPCGCITRDNGDMLCPQHIHEANKTIQELCHEAKKTVEVIPEANAVITTTPPPTTVALRPGEDVEARKCYADATSLLAYANSRVIKTIDDLKTATEDLSIIAKLKKLMTEKRKGYLAPLKEKSDAIRATYDYLMTPILEADQITRDKMLSYNREQERIRREQEEINRKRMEAAEAEMKLKGELTESVGIVEVIPPPPKKIYTGLGSTGIRKLKKWEVLKFADVQDDMKMIDASKVGKLVRAGIDHISGIRIYEEDSLTVTTRKGE